MEGGDGIVTFPLLQQIPFRSSWKVRALQCGHSVVRSPMSVTFTNVVGS